MSFLSGLCDFLASASGSSVSAYRKAEEQILQMQREGKISQREAREKIQEIHAKRDSLIEGKRELERRAREERDKEKYRNN